MSAADVKVFVCDQHVQLSCCSESDRVVLLICQLVIGAYVSVTCLRIAMVVILLKTPETGLAVS